MVVLFVLEASAGEHVHLNLVPDLETWKAKSKFFKSEQVQSICLIFLLYQVISSAAFGALLKDLEK